MYDAGSASEIGTSTPAMQRVRGAARIGFSQVSGKTRLQDLYQSGSAKVRLPKTYDEPATAVLINTAGGLTGGDRLDYEVTIGAEAHAIVTTQAAERAYRSLGTCAEVTNRLSIDTGAALEWLPQETILFDNSSVSRKITADLSGNARLLALESVVLGRAAMGERLNKVFFKDCWRIRRDGQLVFADDVRLSGNPEDFFKGFATGDGDQAMATLLDCCPDAEDRLAKARASLVSLPHPAAQCAASAWNGHLVIRFLAADSRILRLLLMAFLEHYRSARLPRVWHC
ncbi:urease accessory protein UreD [Roseibium sp.]|uniref:urease accessory protein UreD n=1 Tax=Roseibium sp. TaxID=1936156 RepID=UPI003B522EFD